MVSKFKKLLLCSVFSFGLIMPLASCSNDAGYKQTANLLEFVAPTINIEVGDRYALKYSISPSGARDAKKFWFSSNESIAYVTDGILMGVGKGSATITLVTANLSTTCTVNVSDTGGGDVKSLSLSSSSLTISKGLTATLKAYVNPTTETITWNNTDPTVASYDVATQKVTAHNVGTTTITASISDGISKSCIVTVKDSEPTPGPTPGGKHYTGTIKIGAPLTENGFVKSLQDKFNELTESTVTFNVTKWEEDQGADNMPLIKSEGPDIFPFVSDQTVAFYQLGALYSLSEDDQDYISDNMGADALAAAKLSGTTSYFGYPFAGDNSYVMYYSKSLAQQAGITNMDEITIDELLSAADNKGYEVDFPVSNSFYAVGTLTSYNKGKSLYNLKVQPGGTKYSVTSSYNSDAGVAGAKLIAKMNTHSSFWDQGDTPSATTGVLATVLDCSKAGGFKQSMGNDYAVAPLPYADSTKTNRIANLSGYKFYAINPEAAAGHTEVANAVAQYLAGEYCQRQRFENSKVKPTWLTVLDDEDVQSEPHIRALTIQSQNNNSVPLTTVDPKLWSEAGNAIKGSSDKTAKDGILKLDYATATDADYKAILQALDDDVFVE